MHLKTNIFQNVDYSATLRNGKVTTVGETWLKLMAGTLYPVTVKKAAPVVATVAPGKQLFNVMMEFYKMGLHVVTEKRGRMKFMIAVELNKEVFPVNYSKKMNRVVIFDKANNRSLTLEQFKTIATEPQLN